MRRKILFVAEGVSLAHVARPTVLASTIDLDVYDVAFASSGKFPVCAPSPEWEFHQIDSIEPSIFLERLANGKPVYTEAELTAYINADIALLQKIKPDCVIGDFRLSLPIAARLLRIPLLSLCNAHWSPYATTAKMFAPDIPIARILSFGIFDRVFRIAWPLASRAHCAAINKIRKKYGMPVYSSLQEYYCDGDVSLYADIPSLVPTSGAPATHQYIGPIVWSPAMAKPAWWGESTSTSEPRVYITLGSTGSVDLLPAIVDACLAEGFACVVATAGRRAFESVHPKVWTSSYLPGAEAAQIASLVICNGGSATAFQSLAAGTPVLGICSNLDQVLTMTRIQAAGAGTFLRAGEVTSKRLRSALREILSTQSYRTRAAALQHEIEEYAPAQRLEMLLKPMLGLGSAEAS
jgi:UDP:flavonoid glycosyltransferase YjiC (YdhE family)